LKEKLLGSDQEGLAIGIRIADLSSYQFWHLLSSDR